MTERTVFGIKNNATLFPDAHTIVRGGIKMEIKHTHPVYEDSKQREEAIEGAKKACISAVAALKGNVCKYSA